MLIDAYKHINTLSGLLTKIWGGEWTSNTGIRSIFGVTKNVSKKLISFKISCVFQKIWHHFVYWPNCLDVRIFRLLLCEEEDPTNECPRYDTKQSDGEVPVMMEVWGMRNTHSLSSLPGPLLPRVVEPDRVCMDQVEQRSYAKLNCLKWNTFEI